MHTTRKSGILLHPTSLPGSGGIGSLGGEARSFVDFLAAAGQSLWQVLPLGPTGYGNSPYSCYSAFAGNPLLINLETLVAEGDSDVDAVEPGQSLGSVDFDLVERHKIQALDRGAARFLSAGNSVRREEFRQFCETTPWLADYTLFMALKREFNGACWNDWPEALRDRDPATLAEYRARLDTEIGTLSYIQWQFFRQWRNLKRYANQRGVEIVGDLPIFVAYDSADVWANPSLFKLDSQRRSTVVAGVPPDYFSATGQLWGNPLYNWEHLAATGYGWWIERMRASLDLYDIVRIDHFRGFAACWEVPAGEVTAINGRWVDGPGPALFDAIATALGRLPIIAEDLGVITPDVEDLRDRFCFPGMKILHFAFDSGPDNPYLPHNHIPNSVVYTGTHDNDTTEGWYAHLSEHDRRHVRHYLHYHGNDITWEMIRTALASVAATAIIPLQDLLCVGSECRMNMPGTVAANWSWRFSSADLTSERAARLLELTALYGRKQPDRCRS